MLYSGQFKASLWNQDFFFNFGVPWLLQSALHLPFISSQAFPHPAKPFLS